MKIAVIGLGYVGAVSVAGLAELGHSVIGVDIDDRKTAAITAGASPVAEKGLDELIATQVSNGKITTSASIETIRDFGAEVIFVSVGTPSRANGAPDLSSVMRVADQLGRTYEDVNTLPIFVLRSTVTPGTTRADFAGAIARAAGLDLDAISVAYNPEFLREGSGLNDFFQPPKTVVGAQDTAHANVVLSIYDGVSGPAYATSVETAEFAKYADNCFHAVKATYANELARIASAYGVPVEEVFELFISDTKLNASAAYLQPGFAFGGSCLPKDLRAMSYLSREAHTSIPMINSVLESNDGYVEQLVDYVLRKRVQSVLFLGLTFKSGTDDLRESPFLRVARALLGRGIDVTIVDPEVDPSRLHGANLIAALDGHTALLDRFVNPESLSGKFDVAICAKEVSLAASRATIGELVDARVGADLASPVDDLVPQRVWDVTGSATR